MKTLLATLSLALSCNVRSADVWPTPGPRLARVVASFAQAELATRKQFATIAMDTMLNLLRQEFTAAAARDGVATRHWQSGAWSYVSDLQRLAQRIPDAKNIDLAFEANNVLRIAIDEHQAMLNSPRLSQQQRLNADIAALVCDEMPCTEEFARDLAQDDVPRIHDVRMELAFSDRGPPLMSASDGLHCVFKDLADLRLKKSLCTAVMEELRTLADALQGAAEQGRMIDWDSLRINSSEGGIAAVTYNLGGDFFSLALPNLARGQDIWLGAKNWLQSRLHGNSGEYFISVAEQRAIENEFEQQEQR